MRIAVLGGDCAGLKYHIGLEDFRWHDDICIKSKGIKIFVDHLSLPYLYEATIDWVEVDNEAGFVILNPNKGRSQGGCGKDGEGCMTKGDGKTCLKSSGCSTGSCGGGCSSNRPSIVYTISM